ncbi:hypothetical protein BV22DRAFT_1192101 [Leucogyrophana mollusca]|uniref:Uncharacterized protein n=1 Tax=Leucogyrophana mollusca TaxID=85980 RepID=A0ACB8BVV6_9AGAM|nr:hypothetical protein BV22DRAFT_1192101 [Leucogyrophana mollusca]
MSGRQQRVMVQPINVIFKNLQQRTKVVIWLYDNIEMRIEGRIIALARWFLVCPVWIASAFLPKDLFTFIGFDEFMNVVIDEAAEVYVKDAKPRRELGRILLKGDNITLIQQVV